MNATRMLTTAEKARLAPEPSCCDDYDMQHPEAVDIDRRGVGDVVMVCDGCGRVRRTNRRERVYL